MTLPARPAQQVTLFSWALCTLDDAKTYLKRVTDDQVEIVKGLINEATAVIEMYCRRRLKSRTYNGTGGNPPAWWVDGSGTAEVLTPEWPVTGVTTARYKSGDLAGTLVALDITQWYERPNGILVLPFQGFPKGIQNIELTVTAGYLAGIHDRELLALKLAIKRVLQVNWQDWDQGVGRGTGFNVAGQSVSLIDNDLPKDVKRILAPFERLI